MKAIEVFQQNDGDVTRAYYEQLAAIGPAGRVAVALFRAQKRSTRAKQYRGGRFRRAAYDVKQGYTAKDLRRMKPAPRKERRRLSRAFAVGDFRRMRGIIQ